MNGLLYRDMRSEIKPCDVLFMSGHYWMSRIIRRWTMSRFSHVGIAHWCRKRCMVIEAVEGIGVRCVPLSWLLETYRGEIQLWRVCQEPFYRDDAVAWATGQLGKRYSRRQWWSWVFPWLRSEDLERDKYVCSEFVWRVLLEGQFNFPEGFPKVPSPGDFVGVPGFVPMGKLLG